MGAGGGDLRVRVENDAGLELARAQLVVDYTSLDGLPAQRFALLRDQEDILVPALPPGAIALTLMLQGGFAAKVESAITAGSETLVVLTTSRRSARVHLTDAAGEPIAGARIMLQPALGTASVIYDVTNASGDVVFRGVRPGPHIATVWHTSHGMLTDAPVEIPAGDQESEHDIVIKADAGFRLVATDGQEPLQGIGVLLANKLGTVLMGQELPTGPDGALEFRLLEQGIYHVLLKRPDVWPVEVDFAAQPDFPLYPVPMRRLGDLSIRILSAQGVPYEGMELNLVDSETAENVASWVEQGRVISAQKLKSDKHGEIEILGLPRGIYRWSLPPHALEGELLVPFGEGTKVLLTIPD
jgi:hypothetical protein